MPPPLRVAESFVEISELTLQGQENTIWGKDDKVQKNLREYPKRGPAKHWPSLLIANSQASKYNPMMLGLPLSSQEHSQHN